MSRWKVSVGCAALAGLGLGFRTQHQAQVDPKQSQAPAAVDPLLVSSRAVGAGPDTVPTQSRSPGAARGQAHLLAVMHALPGEAQAARHEQLEAALQEEPTDPDRSDRVELAALELLRDDPELAISEVLCTASLCRIRMDKPLASLLDWPKVDERLASIATGETIFAAEPRGTLSTGYVYFSEADMPLPLDTGHTSVDAE